MTTKTRTHRVDVDIDQDVMKAARARLSLINAEEREKYGMSRTWMADVGRAILVGWSPPEESPPEDEVDKRGYRRHNGADSLMPLRFSVGHALYIEKSQAMRQHRTTVTRVLEEGLERFARTGKY
jgi:hypothetical protein